MADMDLKKYLNNLERLPCNCCGSDDSEILFRKERFGLPLNTVICRNCGSLYICPRPSKSDYEEFYKSDYRVAVSGTDRGLDGAFNEQVAFTQNQIIPFIEKYRTCSKPPKTVFDVGCSYGGILYGLCNAYVGAEAHGIEPVVNIAKYAAEKTGGHVRVGVLENYDVDVEMDLVVFIRALNHTMNPRENLLKIRSLLSERGVFILIVQDAVSALLNRPPERMAEMTHPYMFTRETLRYFLDQLGLEIIAYEDDTLDAAHLNSRDAKKLTFRQLFVAVRKAEPGIMNVPRPDWKKIKQRCDDNIEYFQKHKAAILAWQTPSFFMRVYRKLNTLLGRW